MSNDATPQGGGVSDGKAPPDWVAIERAFRAGVLSNSEIARQQNISEGAIRKRAKRDGWVKDLTARVQEKARADLVRDTVRGSYTDVPGSRTEQEVVDQAAETLVQVVRLHRSDIRSGRRLLGTLAQQLENAVNSRAELEEFIIEETPDADNPDVSKERQRRSYAKRQLMLRAIELPAHAGVMKDLSAGLKNLIYLERQAYSIPDEKPKNPGDDDAPPVVTDYKELRNLIARKRALPAPVTG